MKIACVAIVAAVLAAVAVSAMIPEVRDTVVERHVIPDEYAMVGFPVNNEKVTFILALKQRNLDVLEKKFWAISTPGNAMYQEFMSKDEILDLVAPAAEDHAVVYNWLLSNGVMPEAIEDHRDALKVRVSANLAAQLFQSKFYVFRHQQRRDHFIVRALGAISMPRAVNQRVHMVTGVSDFPPLMRSAQRVSSPQAGIESVVPQTLFNKYGFPQGANATGISQGVAEFGAGQAFSPSDLKSFAEQTNLNISPLEQSHIVNPLPPTGVEGTLDIQYVAATGIGATNWYWTEENWLYDFATSFFQASEKPDVISISYGWSELQQCQLTNECSVLGVDSEGYVSRTNVEFQKIGANGVSLLCASGDSGANGRSDPGCSVPELRPSYPAASPYITAVGATQLETGCQQSLSSPPPVCQSGQYACCSGGEETAVSYDEARFASGGGFSNFAPMPDYQKDAVQAYLSSGVELPPASYFNKTNRAFPDVASLGHNVLIYIGDQGGFVPVGGTSASSPEFAGVMSLLNVLQKKKSGKPLGFLNPLLYKMYGDDSSTFTDVTKGDNICTEQGCSSSCKGFRCAAGWDPVTGLGVPNVGKMIEYINRNL